MSRQRRQWTRLSNVITDLDGLLNGIGHEATKIRLSYGTLEIARQGTAFEVRLYGTGGGFCWARTWEKHELRGWLENQCDDIEFRRPQ